METWKNQCIFVKPKHVTMSKKNKKNRVNVVYSTNSDFEYDNNNNNSEDNTLKPSDQNLRVQIEKNKRGGKTVTLIMNFVGTNEDLKALAKDLKGMCGVGGSVKDGEIIIQGDFKIKIIDILQSKGYSAK